jgi:lambda repressor-like predicted transcriptional regulator
MVVEVPATRERIDARLVEDGCGLSLQVSRRSGVIDYALRSVLDMAWRIVDATRAERALLVAHGLQPIHQTADRR